MLPSQGYGEGGAIPAQGYGGDLAGVVPPPPYFDIEAFDLEIDKELDIDLNAGGFEVDLDSGAYWYPWTPYGTSVQNTEWKSQPFNPPVTAYYDRIYFRCATYSQIPPSLPLTIGIYPSDGSNHPIMGSPLVVFDVPGTTFPFASQDIPTTTRFLLDLPNKVLLNAGTVYCLVFSSLTPPNSAYLIGMPDRNYGAPYYTYRAAMSTNMGSSWSDEGNQWNALFFGVLKAGPLTKHLRVNSNIGDTKFDGSTQAIIKIPNNDLNISTPIWLFNPSTDQSNLYNPSGGFDRFNHNVTRMAQSFVPSVTAHFTGLKLPLYLLTEQSFAFCTVAIYATDVNGFPTGSPIDSVTFPNVIVDAEGNIIPVIPVGYPSSEADWFTVMFPNQPLLTAGVKYAFVLTNSLTNNASINRIARDNTNTGYALGTVSKSINMGAWVDQGYDFPFREYYGGLSIFNVKPITVTRQGTLNFTLQREVHT
jgi:hypothetical protein